MCGRKPGQALSAGHWLTPSISLAPGCPMSIPSFQSTVCLVSSSSNQPRELLADLFTAAFWPRGSAKNAREAASNRAIVAAEIPCPRHWKNPGQREMDGWWAGVERQMSSQMGWTGG